MTAVGDRLAAAGSLRGVLIRLPAEVELVETAAAGMDFVVVDLIDGPLDEIQLVAHLRLARAAGLLLLATVDDSVVLSRLARLGVDAAVTSTPRGGCELEVIGPAHLGIVERADQHSAAPFTALDLRAARADLLSRFATAADIPVGPLPVVLLAGQLGDVAVWDDVVAALPPSRGRLALRIDLDDSIVGAAETVLAAAPPRFVLVGHSLGAIVALQIYRTAPARVDRLALLNASGRGPSQVQLDTWATQLDQLDAGGFDELVNTLADANLDPDHPDRQRHRAKWDRMARTVGAAGLRRQLQAQTTRPDSLPTLSDIDAPTMVLSGARDTVCRPELQAELVAGLPNAQHVTLAGVGHMAPLEAPLEVAAQLARWLAD